MDTSTILFLSPVILVSLATGLLGYGLRNRGRIGWGLLTLGALTSLCIPLPLLILSAFGSLWPAIAFLSGLLAEGGALLGMVILGLLLPGKHKLVAVMIPLIIPVLGVVSIEAGETFSPESTFKRNGTLVVEALEKYRRDHGTFPDKLTSLLPGYLDDLRTPPTLWGWLYIADRNTFSLGFVEDVDGWAGYSIYLYTSDVPRWRFYNDASESTKGQRMTSGGPFKLGPTPMGQPPPSVLPPGTPPL